MTSASQHDVQTAAAAVQAAISALAGISAAWQRLVAASSVRDAARLTGQSRSVVHSWAHGRLPGLDALHSVADTLAGRTGEPPPPEAQR